MISGQKFAMESKDRELDSCQVSRVCYLKEVPIPFEWAIRITFRYLENLECDSWQHSCLTSSNELKLLTSFYNFSGNDFSERNQPIRLVMLMVGVLPLWDVHSEQGLNTLSATGTSHRPEACARSWWSSRASRGRWRWWRSRCSRRRRTWTGSRRHTRPSGNTVWWFFGRRCSGSCRMTWKIRSLPVTTLRLYYGKVNRIMLDIPACFNN